MSGFHSFIKNVSLVFVSRVITTLISTGAMLFLIRYLLARELGIFSYVITLITILGIISDLGMGSYFIRKISKSQEDIDIYFSKHFSLQLVILVCISVIVGVLILTEDSTLKRELIAISSIGLLFTILHIPFATVLTSFHDFRYSLVASIATSSLTAAMIFTGIYYDLSLHFFILIGVLSNTLNFFIVFLYSMKYIRFRSLFRFTFDGQFIVKGFPFVVTLGAGILYNRIDIIMLEKMSSDSTVGIYSAANKIIYLLFIIPASIHIVFYPLIAKYHEHEKEKLIDIMRLSTKYSAIVSVLIAVPVFFLSKYIILIFGNEYTSSVGCLRILIWSFIAYCCYLIGTDFLAAGKNIKYVMYVNLFGIIANIVLNYVLIKKLSFDGAAYATLMTKALICLLIGFKMKSLMSEAYNVKEYLKIAICSLISIGVAFLFSNSILSSCIFILIFSLLVMLLKVITNEEWNLFKSVARKMYSDKVLKAGQVNQ